MDSLELHIRNTLGQTDYYERQYDNEDECHRPDHLRFNFDSQDDPDIDKANRAILELFNPEFNRFRVVLKSWKGGIEAIIVRRYDYFHRKYWDLPHRWYYTRNDSSFPYVMYIDDLHNSGTVEIIRRLIKVIKELESDRIYLNIPSYNSKFASSLGAKRDSDEKLWFIPQGCYNRNLLLSHFTIVK